MSTGASPAEPTLDIAIAAFRDGRVDEARTLAERIWQHAANPGAAVMLAQIDVEAGRHASAVQWNERASAANPGNAAIELQAAHHLVLAGEAQRGFDLFASVLPRAVRPGKAWLQFAVAAQQIDRSDQAIPLILDSLRQEATPAAYQALLNLLPDTPPPATEIAPVPQHERRRISVVTCSVDDARFVRMSESYARALADWPHEIVRISDAKSLAEGYTRGFAKSDGETIIFTHDDVEILPDDFGHRLVRRLEGSDILGVAGATRATGPIWSLAGHPHLHGSVTYPDKEGYLVNVYSRTAPIARGIRVMDGLFLAMPREVAARVGWDAETCTGFHGYDVDFTLRAAKLGLRLAVACDLGVVHHSGGAYNEAWRVAAERLMQRHAELRGPFSDNTFCFARKVAGATQALALVDRWSQAHAHDQARHG